VSPRVILTDENPRITALDPRYGLEAETTYSEDVGRRAIPGTLFPLVIGYYGGT
jgi:hypothetical protein